MVSSQAGIRLFLNGELKKSYPKLKLKNSELQQVQLVAGTTPAGTSDWRGDIYGLAVYGDTLSAAQVALHMEFWQSGTFDQPDPSAQPLLLYPFNERGGNLIHNRVSNTGNWLMPDNFQILRKTFLRGRYIGRRISRSLLKDIIMNIAGFVLLGFFMALYLKRSIQSRWFVILYVFVICSLLSLAIEYLQVHMPLRDSSLLDFILNSGGGLIGAMGILVVEKVKRLQE